MTRRELKAKIAVEEERLEALKDSLDAMPGSLIEATWKVLPTAGSIVFTDIINAETREMIARPFSPEAAKLILGLPGLVKATQDSLWRKTVYITKALKAMDIEPKNP